MMWKVGWPMFVSGVCRLAMVSMDVLFVGHLPPAAGPHSPAAVLDGVSALPAFPEGGARLALSRRLEEEYSTETFMSAASLSDMCTTVLFVPLMAFSISLNPLVGQAVGSSNKKMAGVWLQLSMIFLVCGFLPVLGIWMFVGQALSLLGFDQDVCTLAGLFARISAIWPLPNGIYLSLRCYFQAMGNSRPAMWNGICFVGVNALLNWCFVYGGPFKSWIGWGGIGFIGAAVSMDVSRTLQPLLYYFYMIVWKKHHVETWPGWTLECMKKSHIKAFVVQAVPQAGTMLLQICIMQTTTLLVAKLGPLAVAASSAALWGLAPLAWSVNFTLNTLAAMRVGFYLGKGEPQTAKRCAWLCISLGFGFACVMLVCIMPITGLVMKVMTRSEPVRALAGEIVPARLVENMASIVVQMCTGGILAAQGRTRLATYMSLFFELPLSLGTVVLLVLYFKVKDVRAVFWAQAACSTIEACIVMFLVHRSDWELFSRQAQERQGVGARAPLREASNDAGEAETKKVASSDTLPDDQVSGS